ncbi:MAG: FtsQ-type POTRA domain-containing protein [Oscillospiraceae bacterium]|nr:FtsQ-type POTRA domain-containing protein [Oscillospiraceae bacterium]
METKEKKKTAPASERTASQGKTSSVKARSASHPVAGRTAVRTKPVKKAAPAKRPLPKRKVKRPSEQPTEQRKPTPDVVYTEPGLFNRNRVILRVVTVVAVVLALIFGISIFFKVETVTVAGCQKYSAAEVKEASGIREGDNLLGLNDAHITSSIIGALPYVKRVRVGIKLPNTVKIEIVELDVVYAIEAEDGSWWLIRSDGTAIEKTNAADAELYTKILGVKVTKPEVGEKTTAFQPHPQETTPDGETVPITVRAEEQLDTAVSIMQYLEEYGVLGAAASINVENLGDLEVWYGTRYQVLLGDTLDLKNKVARMKAAIDSAGDTQTGILDVTFTVMPDQVICTPFG